MANPGFQTINFGFQGQGEFGFQTQQQVVVTTTPVVGGTGKSRKKIYNEIIELEGKRWSVPKDKVAEFLSRFETLKAPSVEIQTARTGEIDLRPVSFMTPTGKVVTTTRQVLKDDIGVILVMCALADEDFNEA